jgi:hypothetical protein
VKGFIGTVPCRPIQRRILVLELFWFVVCFPRQFRDYHLS